MTVKPIWEGRFRQNKKNKGCQVSVNTLRPKCQYLPEPKPQPTQRDRQPKSAAYFSREETNRFCLTPIIPPSSKTSRWNKNRDLLPRSARGHHSLIHQRKSSFNTAMTAGGHKESCHTEILLSPGDDYFSLVKTERLRSQTRRRREFFLFFAISKFLIRQQSSSERHGCSLLHQCRSYLIATAHVVWWREMLTGLGRVVFSLKSKTVCLSKAFGSARSKTWLPDKVNWMFCPPRWDFESQEAKLNQRGASFSCKVCIYHSCFSFSFVFVFFCVWQVKILRTI